MCGIAGLLNLDGQQLPPLALGVVKAMTDRIAHRGPDGEGQWLDGPVCLGHRRLSIIDVTGGSQPMSDSSGRLTIVFNGEIYNFRELREELSARGAVFRTDCDTEVILAAYGAWGEECLEKLEGMFAFALWDSGKRSLFCARDHFGKKPLFYTVQNGVFAFSSELSALSLLGRLPDFAGFRFSLSPHALMRYLAYEYVPTPETVYAEARALEPAHALRLRNGELEIWRYWDLPMPDENMRVSEADLAGELEHLMTLAVRRRMISDVPLGVFLSGGIDSTIVAGLMARLSPTPIETFSIGFEEASYDESRYARLAATAYGSRHHERILSAEACAEELPGIARSMDTPLADASCAPTWLLAALAREHVTVALGGDGADELWAGYEHYIGYKLSLWYNAIPAFIRKGIIKPAAAHLPASAGYINPRLAVATFLRGAASPDWLRVQTMLTAITPEMQTEILDQQWLGSAGRDFLKIDALFAPTRRQYEHWSAKATPLERAFHVYCRQFLLDDILVKVDRCSMLHSLEVRAPFLDKHVAEFAARLPISCKLHGFRRKYLLKKAFSELLPPQILHRNKRGFQIPVAAWLRGKLRPLLEQMARPELLKKQGVFNAAAIRKLMDAHFSGKEDLRKQLWTFLVFQLWWEANYNCSVSRLKI